MKGRGGGLVTSDGDCNGRASNAGEKIVRFPYYDLHRIHVYHQGGSACIGQGSCMHQNTLISRPNTRVSPMFGNYTSKIHKEIHTTYQLAGAGIGLGLETPLLYLKPIIKILKY